MSNLSLKINHSLVDDVVGGSGTEWITVDSANDYFIFSQGSGVGGGVSDGDAIPSSDLLNRYATTLDPINPVNVAKYFLAQISSNTLKEIKLAGNQNKRYVFACDFDGATATEPVLEAWDNISMDSYLDDALGSNIPANSWYKAVSTNLVTPGTNWTGTPLAGGGILNSLLLNNGSGALTGAGILYFNFKVKIPGGFLTPGLHTPVLVIVYTSN